jgi:hypothetical protein
VIVLAALILGISSLIPASGPALEKDRFRYVVEGIETEKLYNKTVAEVELAIITAGYIPEGSGYCSPGYPAVLVEIHNRSLTNRALTVDVFVGLSEYSRLGDGRVACAFTDLSLLDDVPLSVVPLIIGEVVYRILPKKRSQVAQIDTKGYMGG